MITAILGLLLGVGAVLLGNTLEGSPIEALVQPTAALIVFGGTTGATMLSAQPQHFGRAIKALTTAFFHREADLGVLVREIISVATIARKEGILALDNQLNTVKHAFLKQYLRYIIDGYDPEVVKKMIEDAIDHEESEKMAVAKVWETAGGYSPTIGILGAVLGLIQVMSNLQDSSKLGAGIAVAFVATVYGVGAANLALLPIANRLRGVYKSELHALELVAVGLIGIQAGLNPRVVEERVRALMGENHGGAPGTEGVQERQAA